MIGLMKDELVVKIMTEFAAVRPKTYSCLMDDGKNDKKAKATKKCVIKRILKFSDYKNCLMNNESIIKSQQRFKSEAHSVYIEEFNKIALSSNDDKRLQAFDGIPSYSYGKSAGKLRKTEIITQMKIKQNIIQNGYIFQIFHTEYLL